MKNRKMLVIAVVVMASIIVLASMLFISAPPKVPAAPQNISASPANAIIILSWQAPFDNGGSNIMGYKLYRSQSSADPYSLIASPSGLTYSDTNLTNGQSYVYYVRAFNAAGEGLRTVNVTATPFTVPGVPTGLMQVPGSGQASLNWTAPVFNGGSPITRYDLYRSTTMNGTYSLLASISGLKYNDTNRTVGQSYWYKVCAVNTGGGSNLTVQMLEQAQNTGDQAINNVASGFVVQDVMGTVNNENTAIINLTIQLRLQADSPTIEMDQVSIQFVSDDVNNTLYFAIGSTGAVAGMLYGAEHSGSAPWTSSNCTVQHGDLVTVHITGLTLGYSASATVKIIPAHRSSTLICFVTPSYYSTTYVNLK